MAQESRSIGGFFTPQGELIDSRAVRNSEESSRTSSNKSQENVSAPAAEDTKSISRALDKVSERTRAQVDRAIDANNAAENDVEQAREIVGAQREKLKELKQAKKDNASEEDINRIKAEFSELEAKRNALSEEISKNSRERELQGSQVIRVGNREVGRSDPASVSLSQTKVNLDSPEGIRAAQDELAETADSLSEQRKAVREERRNIRETFREARAELNRIEDSSVAASDRVPRAFDEANELAQRVAQQISAQGGASIVNTFNPQNVSKLLAA